MTWQQFKGLLGVFDDGSRDQLLVDVAIYDAAYNQYDDGPFWLPPNKANITYKGRQHIHTGLPDMDIIRLEFEYHDADFSPRTEE